jgi:nucleotide-binding universal stress UspA family protein
MKIVVGIDGSEPSRRAIEWCAQYASALGAEVIAAHAIDIPVIVAPMSSAVPIATFAEVDRDQIREVAHTQWCAALEAAGVPFRVVIEDDSPAHMIIECATKEEADLVVVGRRGRGGFAELLLGGTSYALVHHLRRPLAIIP